MIVDWQQLAPLIIGYLGSILLILSMISQLHVYFVSKDVSTLSYGFIFFQLAVNIMYLIYNISILSIPVLVGNASMVLSLLIMLGQKYYYTHVYRPPDQIDIEMNDFNSASPNT